MIELKDGHIDVRTIGKTNVVLIVTHENTTAQINMRKVKSLWEYAVKKDSVDWRRAYQNNREDEFGVKFSISRGGAQSYTVEHFIIPKLEKYLYEKEIEKILLH